MTNPGKRRERISFSQKRKFETDLDQAGRESLAAKVTYLGNAKHKSNPGNYNLTPPAAYDVRADAGHCDITQIFDRDMADKLLKTAIKKGLISKQTRGGYPQNVWAVTDQNIVVQANLDNQGQGTYHGYPLLPTDPFVQSIKSRWQN
jgi:hypothetical protein